MKYTTQQLTDMPVDHIVAVRELPMSYRGDSPYILQNTVEKAETVNLTALTEYADIHDAQQWDTYILLVIDEQLCAVFGMTGHIAYDGKVLTKVY
jgi:hypothetical protein